MTDWRVRQGTERFIEWACVRRSLDGDAPCGDIGFVRAAAEHAVIVAIDGLGHGAAAAKVAAAACRALDEHACECDDPSELVVRCHRALSRSRGVVMSLAVFRADDDTMAWLGVGNVRGRFLRGSADRVPTESLLLRGGVVGYELPPLRVSTVPVRSGDCVVCATDGIRGSAPFAGVPQAHSLERAARELLDAQSSGSDDALILVARYLGGER